jgi:site-specific recombinase XerD
VKKIQIERDLLAKFEGYPLDAIDRFMLQTHVNDLAERMSQDRVKQARSYLKSIFDEAVDEEFLTKDPSRKLRIPKNLRPKDKQVLTWEQLWLALQETGKERSPPADAGHDRGAAAERAVRSALALLR